MIRPRWLVLLLPLAVLVTALAGPAPARAGMPEAAASSGSALDVLREAYDNLLNFYVDPLPPAEVLGDAWNGAAGAAVAAGVDPVPVLAPLAGDPDEAWNAFAASFMQLELAGDGQITRRQLAYAAINAMTDSRHECHTYFLPPDAYARLLAESEGRDEFVGIGVQVSTRAPYTIVAVFPGGPADVAGLAAGDVIAAVDGVPAAELTLPSLGERIRGQASSPVTLTIVRDGAAPRDITVVRGSFTVPVLTSALRPDGVGVVRLTTFTGNDLSQRLLREALTDLAQRGARGWVLDLRSNGGGSAQSVYSVLGAFLPPGTPAITIERHGVHTTSEVRGDEVSPQLPLAVLIGPGSASGAEVVAAVLHDTNRAQVFGQPSAGCVNLGLLRGLSDGSGMSITFGRALVGPAERVLDGTGVIPDVETAVGPGDPALEAAAASLVGRPAQPASAN